MATLNSSERSAPVSPRVSYQLDYEPPVPAERIDTIEARVRGSMVHLERLERVGSDEQPSWFLGLHQRDGADSGGEWGELAGLTLDEVQALHEAFGIVITEAARRGLLGPVAPRLATDQQEG